jgi:hypothetical protein
MTTKLLDGLEGRARASTWPRCGGWHTMSISPHAVVFHTPEQLHAFVIAEVRRAFTLGQIPAPLNEENPYVRLVPQIDASSVEESRQDS